MGIKMCRNCIHWKTTSQWKGNCKPHHTEKDRWSQDASANGCRDYWDKADKGVIYESNKH